MTRYDPHPQDYDDARTTRSGFTDRRESDETGPGVPGEGGGLREALEALAQEWEWDAASSHRDTMARAMWVGALEGCALQLRAVLAAHPADAPAGPEPDPFLAEIRAAVDAADRDAPQRCGHSSEPMCCPFENFPTLAAWFRDAISREPETPAATHPAAPSAPQNASGVSEDAGTGASVVERAAWVITHHPDPTTFAQALADAGLLADPDEVRRLREECDQRARAMGATDAEVTRLTGERDRARDVAAALERRNARLTEALRDLASGPTEPGYQPYAAEIVGEVRFVVLLDDLRAVLDRALSGGEQR